MVASNEEIAEAVGVLFENYWIVRERQRYEYHLIKSNERELIRHLMENYGLKLIVRSHFIKLEKIPIQAKSWMGMADFNTLMEYALFCCAMAYTEEKGEGEPFLLNELVEEIELFYPEKEGLDWTNYRHRKSLVKVLNKMVDLQLIEIIEGNTNTFAESKEQYEVLYRISKYSRYFIRTYPEDFQIYNSGRDFISNERREKLADYENRVKIFRTLLMEPAILRNADNESEFYYLRNQEENIRHFFEKFTPFSFELTKNVAMLTLHDRKAQYDTFPSLKSLDDCFLQLVDYVRGDGLEYNAYGEMILTSNQWKTLVGDHAARNRGGWSKKDQELSLDKLAAVLLEIGKTWGMLRENKLGNITIMPNFARNIGRYPAGFDSLYPEAYKEKMKTQIDD
ncbi:TIGR02678 family protein [Listeria newyorkensis]|uniref:TIGR02678 family protein n=1 Tax=Listeria newyorkensis TaxID=1497681 RepID=A0ABX4XQ83_9LIST|nr:MULTISPECIES: TIGR02678 family protein [Listeria]KGL41338.1 hypothetical protein EP56_12205 [Listeriaceae bacterium FSL A5-0209]KGL44674.1 hypothetical protein EP58_04135 [Listeria newyorkensis]PNP93811.1 TIGR02678 family protein [Listeria newyorkensis]RQW67313.1 TIGR02678 family protein [Listeria sp. SHR_NRA_18]SQC50817.1 Protein of uncharacterised function (DUF2398) [Listeria newyorkensis]